MSELTDKIKDFTKKAAVGLALGVVTHTATIHIFNSMLKDGSGVYATQKAFRNAGYNGSPCTAFVSTYADEMFDGPAAFLGPVFGAGVGIYAARRTGKKKK